MYAVGRLSARNGCGGCAVSDRLNGSASAGSGGTRERGERLPAVGPPPPSHPCIEGGVLSGQRAFQRSPVAIRGCSGACTIDHHGGGW